MVAIVGKTTVARPLVPNIATLAAPGVAIPAFPTVSLCRAMLATAMALALWPPHMAELAIEDNDGWLKAQSINEYGRTLGNLAGNLIATMPAPLCACIFELKQLLYVLWQ